jgi:hypothetical protein
VFPPVKQVKGSELEEEFHKFDDIYFAKGL